jgi:hypothetical protein
MMKRVLRWKGMIGLLVLAVLPAMAAEAQRPNLQGTWKLDEDLTARIRARDQQASPEIGFPEGMSGPTGGGLPGGRFPDGDPDGGFPGSGPTNDRRGARLPSGPPEDEKSDPPPSLKALDTLTITQKDGEITIADQEGHVRNLKTDNSKVRDEKAPRGPADLRARWEKDGTLTVKVLPAKGARETESYVISNDRKHLYLTVVIDSDGLKPPLKILRAYQPAPEAPAAEAKTPANP